MVALLEIWLSANLRRETKCCQDRSNWKRRWQNCERETLLSFKKLVPELTGIYW